MPLRSAEAFSEPPLSHRVSAARGACVGCRTVFLSGANLVLKWCKPPSQSCTCAQEPQTTGKSSPCTKPSLQAPGNSEKLSLSLSLAHAHARYIQAKQGDDYPKIFRDFKRGGSVKAFADLMLSNLETSLEVMGVIRKLVLLSSF